MDHPDGGGRRRDLRLQRPERRRQAQGSGVTIDRSQGTRVKILEDDAFGAAGTHAAFTGTAEVNGNVERFRIDVDDLGEPGSGVDRFKIVTDSYATGGVLTGRTVQVH